MKGEIMISIITINYNGINDTLEFLESVQDYLSPEIEIIVVDNCSKENPTAIIKERFPSTISLRTEKNIGFAGGNNVGIKASHGKYLFFLNNDTLVKEDIFTPIVKYLDENPNVGILTPKVLYPDGVTIQYAGAIGISYYTGRGKRLGLGERDNGQYNIITQTDLGHGGAMIVPRKVIDEVGEMPEIYFLYYEEHDWTQMILRNGFRVCYYGLVSILHKESVTIGSASPLKTYYLTRNRILYLRRNAKKLQLFLGILFFGFVSLPKNTFKLLLSRQWAQLKAVFDGILWNLGVKIGATYNGNS